MDLVLLPGMNCSPGLWSDVAKLLPGDITVHQPHLDGESVTECVDGLLHDLPRSFVLAGLSLGGIVAMALTRKAPDRVVSLALLDTNARQPTQAQHQGWRRSIDAILHGQSAEETQQELLPLLLAADSDERLVEATLRMARETGDERLVAQLRLQCTREDARPALRDIDVPTLVLGGELDALCPPERHQEIADLIPGARLVLVPGAGHLTPLEAPDIVAHELGRLMGRPSPSLAVEA